MRWSIGLCCSVWVLSASAEPARSFQASAKATTEAGTAARTPLSAGFLLYYQREAALCDPVSLKAETFSDLTPEGALPRGEGKVSLCLLSRDALLSPKLALSYEEKRKTRPNLSDAPTLPARPFDQSSFQVAFSPLTLRDPGSPIPEEPRLELFYTQLRVTSTNPKALPNLRAEPGLFAVDVQTDLARATGSATLPGEEDGAVHVLPVRVRTFSNDSERADPLMLIDIGLLSFERAYRCPKGAPACDPKPSFWFDADLRYSMIDLPVGVDPKEPPALATGALGLHLGSKERHAGALYQRRALATNALEVLIEERFLIDGALSLGSALSTQASAYLSIVDLLNGQNDPVFLGGLQASALYQPVSMLALEASYEVGRSFYGDLSGLGGSEAELVSRFSLSLSYRFSKGAP